MVVFRDTSDDFHIDKSVDPSHKIFDIRRFVEIYAEITRKQLKLTFTAVIMA